MNAELDPKTFDLSTVFTLDGQLGRQVFTGGAYKRFLGPAVEAKNLGRGL